MICWEKYDSVKTYEVCQRTKAKTIPICEQIPIEYNLMENLPADIKHMPQDMQGNKYGLITM